MADIFSFLFTVGVPLLQPSSFLHLFILLLGHNVMMELCKKKKKDNNIFKLVKQWSSEFLGFYLNSSEFVHNEIQQKAVLEGFLMLLLYYT